MLSGPNNATIFLCYCHIFKKKGESNRAALLSKGERKTENGNCFDINKGWADKLAASNKGSLVNSCAGQLCGGSFVTLFISADHIDRKAFCILSYPGYHPAACIRGALLPWVFLLDWSQWLMRDSLPCAFGFASYSWWYLPRLLFSPIRLFRYF